MVGIETIQPRGFGRILIIILWYYYTNTIYGIDMTQLHAQSESRRPAATA